MFIGYFISICSFLPSNFYKFIFVGIAISFDELMKFKNETILQENISTSPKGIGNLYLYIKQILNPFLINVDV